MGAKEFATKLGIKSQGKYDQDNNSFIINLSDSDAYGYAYTKFENSDLLDEIQESSKVNENTSNLQFEAIDEPFIVGLYADFDNDIYQITITRKE